MTAGLRVVPLLALLVAAIPAIAATEQAPSSAAPRSPREPVTPFRVIGNVYYVGTSNAGSFLLTSRDGHVLIDTGYRDSTAWLRQSIEQLGFKLSDIKIILNTHAHTDHVGGHARLKEWTGARVLTSRADAPVIADGGRSDFRSDGREQWTPIAADGIVEDGGRVQVGDTALVAHLTPGHTKGNTTWTTVVEEGGRRYDVVFVGSMGLNRNVPLVGNTRYPQIADDYARSFTRLKRLPCDVFLPFHADHYRMPEKRTRLEQGAASNPFIDPEGYRAYIASTERAFLNQVAKERAGGQ
jgi:metallo-beta-lactamase class B